MPLDNAARVALPVEDVGYLTSRAEDKLRVEFHKRDHKPSEETWRSLRALLGNLEAQARGTAAPVFALSALYCGAGKTSALAAFMDAMLECREFDHVGALILVPRLDLIAPLVAEMKLPEGWLSVLTSDASVNSLGNATDPNTARVLISTHQRLIQRFLGGKDFTSMADLYFNGAPRSVRVVDESIMPGQGLTLTARDALAVPSLLQKFSYKLANRVEDIFVNIRAHKFPEGVERITYDLPDYVSELGLDLNQAIRSVEFVGGEAGVRRLTSLWLLSGRTVTARPDGRMGTTVLDYVDTLPPDFAPALILDASGNVRGAYSAWTAGRGNLQHLPSNTQDYSPLRVHVWTRGGSKSALEEGAEDLCLGVVSTAKAIIKAAKTTPEFLFVVHNPTQLYDCEKTIRALMPTAGNFKMSFTTWGRHDSTNAYRDASHVFLVGTLFLRPSQYEALARAAAGKPSAEGYLEETTIDTVVAGEHAHMILQAALRGRARQSNGSQCKPMHLFVIAAVRTGIPASLPALFPGCRIFRWRPNQKPLEGKALEAQKVITEWLEFGGAKPGAFMPFSEVMKRVDIRVSSLFRDVVRRNRDLCEWLAALDLHEGPRKPTGKFKQGWVFQPHVGLFDGDVAVTRPTTVEAWDY